MDNSCDLVLHQVVQFKKTPAEVRAPARYAEVMRRRRANRSDRALADGPAKLCQALGIDGSLDGLDLCAASSALFLEEGRSISETQVIRGPRVGLGSVPEPWKSIPWNFRVRAGTFPGPAG